MKSGTLGLGFFVVLWAGWPQPWHGAFDHATSPMKRSQFVDRPEVHPTLMSGVSVPTQEIFESTAEIGKEEILPADQMPLLVNLNGSSRMQLAALPGIGLVLADRIVTYRTTHGAFQQVDELLNVSGIGAKRLRRLELSLTVDTVAGKIGS